MADVWACNVTASKPIWTDGPDTYTVPAAVEVTLDIDGAGPEVWDSTTIVRQVEKTADLELLIGEMTADAQLFVDKCKAERAAAKSTKYATLISGIQAGVEV